MEKQMNVESEWSDCIDASKVQGAAGRIEIKEVRCALNQMKIGKSSGLSGVALEMFKAGGDKCLKSLTNIFNGVLFKNNLPEEWMLSLLVTIVKGKGDPLNPNSFKGVKLLEHFFKQYEKILYGHWRCQILIKSIIGLCQGEGLLMLCLFRGDLLKNTGPKISCFFVFFDLKKAFDHMPREVICFVLRWKGLIEYLVDGIMSFQKGSKIAVSVDREQSSSFSVKVDVHQGSALTPLLFTMVVNVQTEDVRDGSLMDLLYADDLVLCGE